MSELKKGDRVKVVRDVYGDSEHLLDKTGTVVQPPQYYQGKIALGASVLLDGATGVLEFMPEEINVCT